MYAVLAVECQLCKERVVLEPSMAVAGRVGVEIFFWRMSWEYLTLYVLAAGG